ncbi:hipa domain protein [Arthrobacter sp. Hiyo6]|nr:hipa domain protein [Arthrobacter sp. Hiyo6]
MGLGLTERAAVQLLELALKATGPLVADLEAGTAFASTTVSASTRTGSRNDDGASPFSAMVTRSWLKELRHRRRLLEG